MAARAVGKATLRAVGDGERRERLTVRAAAADGSRRELLIAMRDRIAVQVDDARTPARDLAALTRRLLEIAKEIETLDAAEKVDDIGAAAATPDEEWPTT